MKTKLTLSALLITTLLAPAAFANPATVEKQTGAEANAVTSAAVTTPQEPRGVNRRVLRQLDLDVRQEIIDNLRSGLAEVLQLAAPVLVEIRIQQFDFTGR
jgi:hypothetical protein